MELDDILPEQWDTVTSGVPLEAQDLQSLNGTASSRGAGSAVDATGQVASCPSRERDRLDDLVAEFGDDSSADTAVVVPLSQRELAHRWGISPGSVQSYLRTQQRHGRVVRRSPLTIARDKTTGPRLRLIATSSDESHSPTGTASPASPAPLGDLLIDALVVAAAAGNHSVVAHLKSALAALLDQPSPVHQSPAQNADQGRVLRGQVRAPAALVEDQESEVEENFSSDSFSGESDLAQNADRAAPRTLEELPSKLAGVVHKRLRGRAINTDSEATPAWDRPGWDPERPWTDDERRDVARAWSAKSFGQPLAGDTGTALELWSPATAIDAIGLLAGRTDTRNPSARLLDAAIWGYHAFFPLAAAPATSEPSWERIATALDRFADGELIDHLHSYVRDPDRLRQKAAVAVATGRIRVEDLGPLRLEPDELNKIVSAAAHCPTGGVIAEPCTGDPT